MAITETRNLPAPFIQSLGEYYGKELPALTKDPMDCEPSGHPRLQLKIPIQEQMQLYSGWDSQVKV